VTLKYGDNQTVYEPRYTKQCYRCEYRSFCPYSMVICHPLFVKESVKGLIGFLGFSEKQRVCIAERSSWLSSISQKVDYIWQSEQLDLYQFLRHSQTTKFIDFFEEGLILTTPDHQILNLNQKAKRFLETNDSEVTGQLLSDIIMSFGEKRSNEKGSRFLKSFRIDDYPFSGTDSMAGHILIVSEKSSERRSRSALPRSWTNYVSI